MVRSSRNNRDTDKRGVRGPTSALTTFLQERGITTTNLGNGYTPRTDRVTRSQRTQTAEDEEPPIVETISVRVTRSVSTIPANNQESTAENTKVSASSSKKKANIIKRKPLNFDQDISPTPNHPKAHFSSKNRGPGIQLCLICGCRFIPTSNCKYSVEGGGYLCLGCSNQDRENRTNHRLLKKIKRESRLKTGCDWFEDNLVPKLEDLCIQTTCENIFQINSLEGIGDFMLEKISKILSKHRKINSEVLELFLQPNMSYLCLFDCARLMEPDIAKIVSKCSSLETLKLYFCGRMNDPLTYVFSNGFHNITELTLHGTFLVTKNGFSNLFEGLGPKLDKLSIQQAPLFNVESMKSLVENCRGLSYLDLSNCEAVNKDCILLLSQGPNHGKAHAKSSKGKKNLDDSALLPILHVIGSGLESLKLDGWTKLTEASITKGIEPCCKSLVELSLEGAEEITPEAWCYLFNSKLGGTNEVTGLHHLNLANCSIENNDKVLLSILRQNVETLQTLNLSGWDSLTHEGIKEAFSDFPPSNLTHVNFSWCREMCDPLAELIVNASDNLKEISVWGCHKITTWFKGNHGLKIVGRECDTL
ncbi:RNI-like protein [Conidiobolus coronatus NRRL 28638]|uniref:RNI-like protein n=1 Tax=Conidiobolus coronatus (strain ATCC 28846 / CBS 209.66 / NRRL 28638) TaxID=796925 RepID=A0A137P517_CONC2|nr:RNI-like protein [Conidiobolus coronatus NRRL 28638]|eukprot:KXN70107.1 RNI-like protein [Conidiobolus coronatus NRRL 28638]